MKITEHAANDPKEARLAIGKPIVFCRLVNGILARVARESPAK